MRFSLRELICLVFAAAGVCGMITNNYWMEREVIRAKKEAKESYENQLDDSDKKYKEMFNALKKVSPETAKLYELKDKCDCPN